MIIVYGGEGKRRASLASFPLFLIIIIFKVFRRFPEIFVPGFGAGSSASVEAIPHSRVLPHR